MDALTNATERNGELNLDATEIENEPTELQQYVEKLCARSIELLPEFSAQTIPAEFIDTTLRAIKAKMQPTADFETAAREATYQRAHAQSFINAANTEGNELGKLIESIALTMLLDPIGSAAFLLTVGGQLQRAFENQPPCCTPEVVGTEAQQQ